MFRFYSRDVRFPEIEVLNEGTTLFSIVKKGKVIDSFVSIEMGMSHEVSLSFAENESKEFFNKLNQSHLLKNYYEKINK